jgi:hypothetical protein
MTGTGSGGERHSPSPLLTQQEQPAPALDTKPAALDSTNATEPITSPVARRFNTLPSISEITSQYRSSLSPYRLGSIGSILPRAPGGDLIANRDPLESIAFLPMAIQIAKPPSKVIQTEGATTKENKHKGGVDLAGGADETGTSTTTHGASGQPPALQPPGQPPASQLPAIPQPVTPARANLKQPPPTLKTNEPASVTPQGPPAGGHAQAIQGPPTLVRAIPTAGQPTAPGPPSDAPSTLHQGPPTVAKPKYTPRNPYDKMDPENQSISARLLASSQNQPSKTVPRPTPGLLAQGFLTSVSRRISWAYVPTFNGPDRVAAEAEETKDPTTGLPDSTPDLNDSPDTNVAVNEGQRLDIYREPMYLLEVNINIIPIDQAQQTHSSADSNITMESSIRDSTLALPSCENESAQDDQHYQDMGTTSTLSIHRLDALTRRHSRYF